MSVNNELLISMIADLSDEDKEEAFNFIKRLKSASDANKSDTKEKVSISANNIMDKEIVNHYDVIKEFGM